MVQDAKLLSLKDLTFLAWDGRDIILASLWPALVAGGIGKEERE